MLKISHTLRLPAIGSKNVIVSVMGDVSSIWFMHWNNSVGFERFYHSCRQRFNFLFANLLTQLHEAA